MAKCSKTSSSDASSAVDRLSALPDELIHTVLSFLPAQEVVRTCVLSRRWRSLWRSTPCINIDQDDFKDCLMSHDDDPEVKWASFKNFTTNLLQFHDNTSSLGEFRLVCGAYNRHYVDQWIRRGIEYRPSVLDIEIWSDTRFRLPPVVGSNFCHLKMLHLSYVDLGSHFARLICSACPVLEDLDLQHCEFSGNSSQAITSSTLKKLELLFCVNETGYPVVITVPSLAYLFVSPEHYEASCISLCKMDSLVEAKIHLERELPPTVLHELLGSLFNVIRLELSEFEVEVMLFERSDKFPIFGNMRTLELVSCFLHKGELKDKLEVLGSFVQNAPCLEKLTLDKCMFSYGDDSGWSSKRENITLKCQDMKTFQCHKLKLIEVVYDKRDNDHRLGELLWSLGRSFPDVNIEVTEEVNSADSSDTSDSDSPDTSDSDSPDTSEGF